MQNRQIFAVPSPPSQVANPGAQPCEPLGCFTGYLRRPKSQRDGLIAQFFGENGLDSDIITTLHLTRFLDAHVLVRVFVIKDSQGRKMKSGSEPYVQLPDFRAIVRRPSATRDGLVAQFFATNGPDSDCVSEQNRTKWLDALVLVQIFPDEPDKVPVPVSETELAVASSRLTPIEAKALQTLAKRAAEAWHSLLVAGFFRREALWRTLGNEMDFSAWLGQQPCCHPGAQPCKLAPVEPFAIPEPGLPFASLPMCRDHAQAWRTGHASLAIGSPQAFLLAEHAATMQRWAQLRLRERLGVSTQENPSASAVYRFAIEHRIAGLLPSGFTAYLPQTPA